MHVECTKMSVRQYNSFSSEKVRQFSEKTAQVTRWVEMEQIDISIELLSLVSSRSQLI